VFLEWTQGPNRNIGFLSEEEATSSDKKFLASFLRSGSERSGWEVAFISSEQALPPLAFPLWRFIYSLALVKLMGTGGRNGSWPVDCQRWKILYIASRKVKCGEKGRREEAGSLRSVLIEYLVSKMDDPLTREQLEHEVAGRKWKGTAEWGKEKRS
jgi:hypothetical protein